MEDTVIKLISNKRVNNEYGVQVKTETVNEVFASWDGVNRSEFFSGGQNGLKPEKMFLTFKGNYNGEEVLEHEGERYTIYRTHQNGDYLELYAEKRKGTE